MIRAALARQIAEWIDVHGGERPSRVRLPRPVFEQLVEELVEWCGQVGRPRPLSAAIDEENVLFMGIPVCIDHERGMAGIER